MPHLHTRLEGHALAAFRGERLVLRDLSFTLAAGEALLLLGPNGSGKSTLLRLLAGLKRPDAGTLLWDGADALADLPTHARRVAYLGHLDAIKPGLTAAENLRILGDPAPALTAMGLDTLADLPRPHALRRAAPPLGPRPPGPHPGTALAAGRTDARPRHRLACPPGHPARHPPRRWGARRRRHSSRPAAPDARTLRLG